MTKAEREYFRDRLLQLARRLSDDVAGLSREALQAKGGEASGNLSNAPLHMADLGTDNFEQELALSFLETKTQTLEEISAALARLERRRFGACERCQKEIARDRLRAVPFARHCIDCAQEVEKEMLQGGRAAAP
jgi:RNA polymerase-binding transcription factor DksA